MKLKHLAEGKYEKAIELYEKFIVDSLKNQKIKDVGMAYHNMGIVYDTQQKHGLAIDCFKKALENHKIVNNYSGVSWGYFSIGLIFGKLNNYESILDTIKKQ